MSRCAEGQHRFTAWLRARVQAEAENTLLAWADYRAVLALYRLHNQACVVCHERMLGAPGVVVPHLDPVQLEINVDVALEIARDKLYQEMRKEVDYGR